MGNWGLPQMGGDILRSDWLTKEGLYPIVPLISDSGWGIVYTVGGI